MVAAGLRLTALQEQARLDKMAGAAENFELQRTEAIAHHQAIKKLIDDKTSPAAWQNHQKLYFGDLLHPLPPEIARQYQVLYLRNENVLGQPVHGFFLAVGDHWATQEEAPVERKALGIRPEGKADFGEPMKDVRFWNSLRQTLNTLITDPGQVMVNDWLKGSALRA